MPAKYTPEQRIAVFWSRIDQNGPVSARTPDMGCCWLWTGACTPLGYGHMGTGVGKQLIPTHRFAWELEYGQIPGGAWVLHHCDNPPCCRPSHLFLGDAIVNARDMAEKGRSVSGVLVPGARVARGERQGHAKLTDEQVLAIRATYAENHPPLTVLACQYGLDGQTISDAIKGRTWAHLPGATPIVRRRAHS